MDDQQAAHRSPPAGEGSFDAPSAPTPALATPIERPTTTTTTTGSAPAPPVTQNTQDTQDRPAIAEPTASGSRQEAVIEGAPSRSGVSDGLVGAGNGEQVEVFGPAVTSSDTTPSEARDRRGSADLDSAFFEPTLSDVQAHHASVVARSKRLNEAPLLTSKYRDQDQVDKDKKKAEKWPTTTIRVKFSDGTQIQRTFPSSSPIQPVYEFVRSSVDPPVSSKPFMLWQPPRYQYPEHPVPTKKPTNPHRAQIIPPASYGHVKGGTAQGLQGGTGGKESLSQLGLVPQSVLLVKWSDESMNASGYRAPLRPDLLDKVVPLPPAQPKDGAPMGGAGAGVASNSGAKSSGGSGEKKIPKWLQKGLMKKK